eukprot:CFRG3714T1
MSGFFGFSTELPKDLKDGLECDGEELGGALEDGIDDDSLLIDKDDLNDDTFGDTADQLCTPGAFSVEPSASENLNGRLAKLTLSQPDNRTAKETPLLTPGDMLRESDVRSSSQYDEQSQPPQQQMSAQMYPTTDRHVVQHAHIQPLQNQQGYVHPQTNAQADMPPLPTQGNMSEAELQAWMSTQANRNKPASPYGHGAPQLPGWPYGQHTAVGPGHGYPQNQHIQSPIMYAPSPTGQGPYMPPSMPMRQPVQFDPYANLMTRSEKDFITRIQLAQIQSNNPHIDDFYFQAYTLKKAVDADSGKKLKFYMAKHANRNNKYVPVTFENTLGKIPALSIHAPRPMIESVVRREENGGPQFSRRKFLKAVENGYSAIIRMEDSDIEANGLPESARDELLVKRKGLVDQVFATFALSPLVLAEGEGGAQFNDEYFLRIIHISKAQRLLTRALVYFDTNQAERAIVAVLRNTLTLSQTANGKPVFDCLHTDFLEAVTMVISGFPAISVSSILKILCVNSHDDIIALTKSVLGASILKLLLDKVEQKNKGPSSLEAPISSSERSALRVVAVEVSNRLLEYPGMLLDGLGLVKEDEPVWAVVTQVANFTSEDTRAGLQRHLRPESTPKAVMDALGASC